MIYAGVVAGGKGTRMGSVELPKQFLMLGDAPIIVHTLKRFIASDQIDAIILGLPEVWIEYAWDLFESYGISKKDLTIVAGGAERNETVMNICQFIKATKGIGKDDILITHDGVRPFVTEDVIKRNIVGLKTWDAVTTAIPAVDTILVSKERHKVDLVPSRDTQYMMQTPQSFKLKKLLDLYENTSEDERQGLTDTATIFTLKGKSVGLVLGESSNIKITTPYDLRVGTLLLQE